MAFLTFTVYSLPRPGRKSDLTRLEKRIEILLDDTNKLREEITHIGKKSSKDFSHLKSVADVNYYRYGRKNDILYADNKKRNSVKINLWNPTKKGEKLVIPYSYASNYPAEMKRKVEIGIKAMNDHLKCGHDVWVPHTNQKHRVEIINDGGCYSLLGKTVDQDMGSNSKQPVSIGEGCEAKHIVLHELMHAMGFYHEQNRVDRDKYVRINWNDIEESGKAQFEKASDDNIFQTSVPYDYMSVMHYPLGDFGKDGKPAMTILPNPISKKLTKADLRILGNVPDLSKNDLKELRAYFRCGSNGGGSGGGKTTKAPRTKKPRTKGPRSTTKAPPVTTEAPPMTTEIPTTATDEVTHSTDVPESTENPESTEFTESFSTDDL